jgi:hypothetical protein
MQSSRHDTRGLAAAALALCAALLGIQCGAYFLRAVDDVAAAGHKPALVREFGAGAPVSQSFLVPRDGLHALTIALSSDQPALVACDIILVRKGVLADWPDEPILTRQLDVSIQAGVTRERIEFPPVSRSKARTFVATFRVRSLMPHASAKGEPHVALSAWGDDALRGGTLTVGGQDRWGALAITAQTDPPTRFERTRDDLAALGGPGARAGGAGLALAALLYAALLLGVCYAAFAREGAAARPATAFVASPPRGDLRDTVRAAGAVSLALAALLLLAVILATRERVADDLLTHLDEARMESPMGLHNGFSRVEEVINGVSPPALFAHPPSRVTWSLEIPARQPVLRTSVALRSYVWQHLSDGVEFEVRATDGARTVKKTRFLDPSGDLNDRAWIELDLDLSPFAGRTAEVSLLTSPGPRNNPAYDWALWGDPRIVSVRWFDGYSRSLRALNRARSGD